MAPADAEAASAQVGTTSSDFVRKLYKMLEEPAHHKVVRWSNDGDSFVVLENEKFTKTILPKHFRHSNFASFVRQLNKYDFHKVRHNEEEGDAPYGKDAWEFRHPGFRADCKDNLDNIRRKTPASRKPVQPPAEDQFPATQQMALLNDQLVATQHQVQALQEHYFDLAQTNKLLVTEIMALQKMVKAQNQVSNELISHLSNAEDRRRSSRQSTGHPMQNLPQPPHHPRSHGAPPMNGVLPDGADEVPPELRRAREILDKLSPDSLADRELERLAVTYHQISASASPPESAAVGSTSVFPTQNSSVAPLPMGPDGLNDMRHLVYPVGTTNGIDPFHSDHIQNIPYSRPLSDPATMAEVPIPAAQTPKEPQTESLWGHKKPRILLVEDDKTCSRIGSKFLTHVDCTVDVARDGSEAVAKVNKDSNQYDLIFMDIIMPMMDGVSATACIRLVNARVPIIAMTSNIRQEDISMYFHWGMNDVLAKPFTKDGMIRILKKHVAHLLKSPPPPPGAMPDVMLVGQSAPPPAQPTAATTTATGGYVNGVNGMNMAPMSTAPAVKFESPPLQSPVTTSSWQSPSLLAQQQPSPNLDNGGGYLTRPDSTSNGGMVLTPGGAQRPPHHQFPNNVIPQMPPQLRHVPDAIHTNGDSDRPEKRQRRFGPGEYAH